MKTMNRKKRPRPEAAGRELVETNGPTQKAPFAISNIAQHPVLRRMQPALARLWRRDPAKWFEIAWRVYLLNGCASFRQGGSEPHEVEREVWP